MKSNQTQIGFIFTYYYGDKYYCVRIGEGRRPLVYAIYKFGADIDLPAIGSQIYRPITEDQFNWIKDHKMCDVTFERSPWEEFGDLFGILHCATHEIFIPTYPRYESLPLDIILTYDRII